MLADSKTKVLFPLNKIKRVRLVLVQVESDRQDCSPGGKLLPVYDSVLKSSIPQSNNAMTGCATESATTLGKATTAREEMKEDILASATHQLIHGFPPYDEDEDEEVDEEVDDDFDDPDYGDEGYRTNSSSGGSPSSSVASPSPPGLVASSPCGGLVPRRAEDEEGNLMWLVDFKLDFFNDIEKNGGDYSFKNFRQKFRLMICLFIKWVRIRVQI